MSFVSAGQKEENLLASISGCFISWFHVLDSPNMGPPFGQISKRLAMEVPGPMFLRIWRALGAKQTHDDEGVACFVHCLLSLIPTYVMTHLLFQGSPCTC